MSIILDDDSRAILDHFLDRSISVAEAAERMAVVLSALLDDTEANNRRFSRVVSAGYIRAKPAVPGEPPESSVEPL